jgi:drug/metabolite transporter (DMT)-like permease
MCLIWGSTWLAIKVGLDGVPPFLGAGLRFVLSALIVGLVLAARRRPIRLTRDDAICVVSLGVLVFWLNYAAVYWAETRISSGLTAVLFSTMPLTTALLSHFWMGSEVLGRRKLVGIVIGMSGTVLLFWPDDSFGAEPALGMLAALFASVCSSVSLVMLKRYGSKSDPFVLNFLGMGLGASCLLVMSAVLERSVAIAWSVSNVVALSYLALFGSVIAFSLYYRLVKALDATVVSLSTLIIPILALVLGRVLLDEVITRLAVAGVLTILAGVAVAIVPRVRRPVSMVRESDGR